MTIRRPLASRESIIGQGLETLHMFQLSDELLRLKEANIFIADELVVPELSAVSTTRKLEGTFNHDKISSIYLAVRLVELPRREFKWHFATRAIR